MEPSATVEFKVKQCEKGQLNRNDFIMDNNRIMKCINKSTFSFKNIDSKELSTIQSDVFQKIETLQLRPLKWHVDSDNNVELEGQYLGLGPIHKKRVVSFREFYELNIVNREAAKGRKVYYVVACGLLRNDCLYVLYIYLK